MYERRPPLKLWPVHTQYSNLSNGQSRWWHHVLHIMLNNDSRQRTDSTDTQRHKEPGERLQSICMKRDTCTGPQHCSKPAISERARDSTAQSTNTSQHNISSLYVCVRTGFIRHSQLKKVNHQRFHSQCGKEPRHTALFRIVTRNMWQFLKSDSILSMDSILK